MTWRSAKIKLLSLFVLTFLCFNAGGAVCVAYCQGFTKSVAQKAHCPLAKLGAHCPKQKSSTQNGPAYVEFIDNSVDCCVLSIGFFPAPVEKRHSVVDAPPATATEPVRFIVSGKEIVRLQISPAGYSPPLSDGQFTYIKNRVFRI